MSSHTAQISVFIDTEFTHLCDALNPEPAVLISIGAVTQDSKQHFYAENENTQLELCSGFTMETVLPLLEGGEARMQYSQISRLLRGWVESLDGQVEFWSDSPFHDWPYVQHMFDTYGWPANLHRSPMPLIFDSAELQQRFENGVAEAFRISTPRLRRHHALDDAIANRLGFQHTIKT
jgi:hypothetical protein